MIHFNILWWLQAKVLLIKKHGESELLRKWQRIFNEDSENPAITLNNEPYRMKDLLIQYMYGKYLHLDKDKQQIYRAFERKLGSLAELYAFSQIEKYIGVVLFVAGYIRKNKLHSEHH